MHINCVRAKYCSQTTWLLSNTSFSDVEGRAIINKLIKLLIYIFIDVFRDIGLEAIRQAGFYRITDVRQMEGYPIRTDENGHEITNHNTEFHSLRYRAFTM